MKRFFPVFWLSASLLIISLAVSAQVPANEDSTQSLNFEPLLPFVYPSDIVVRTYEGYYIVDICPTADSIVHTTLTNDLEEYDFCKLQLSFSKDGFAQYLMEAGYPNLPFYSLNLQIPQGSVVTNVRAVPLQTCNDVCVSLEDFEATFNEMPPVEYQTGIILDAPYIPFQEWFRPSYCSLSNIVDINEDYYIMGDTSWNLQHYIFDYENVEINRAHGIALNIYPYQFLPLNNELRTLGPSRFYIEYQCVEINAECSMQQTIEHTIYSGNPIITDFFDCYPPGEKNLAHELENPGDYLIITEDRYATSNALYYFTNHKESLGYNVSLYSFPSSSQDDFLRSLAIKNIIRQKYNDLTDLKNVLIVGSLSALPPSQGIVLSMLNYEGSEQYFEIQENSPPTDIYYECFDSSDDSHLYPRVGVGRWIINSEDELANIAIKTVNEELSTNEFRVALFSGSDSMHAYMENSFRRDCEYLNNVFSQMGAMVHYCDGSGIVDENPLLFTDVLGAHNFWITIYNGHGGVKKIGNPYNLSGAELNQYCPFGFGFACLTGSYHDMAFGAKSLANDDINGFCVYYGSSTYSYINPDRELNRSIFNQLKQTSPTNNTISQLIQLGEQKYYQGHRSNEKVQRQLKRYNIFGDPSLHLYGTEGELLEPQSHTTQPELIAQYRSISVPEKKSLDAEFVYDSLGRLISIGTDNISSLSNGIYFVLDKDTQLIRKIIIFK